jgi:hypothetical protein
MKLFALLMIVVLTSCSSLLLSRDLSENCIAPYGSCSIDRAKSANLEVIRANGSMITVYCGIGFHPLDQEYREKCHKQLDELAEVLYARANGAISKISFSDMELLDEHGCIDTTSGDFDTYETKARIKLLWVNN